MQGRFRSVGMAAVSAPGPLLARMAALPQVKHISADLDVKRTMEFANPTVGAWTLCVQAVRSGGREGALSDGRTVTVVHLDAPTGLAATYPDLASANLAWNAVSGATDYRVYVNGTLVAHGEVVVVNEKFGIRLTDVISPAERIRRLR